MDVNQHAALPFPRSLPEFQRLFPDDMACAAYLGKLRWQNGFVCPHCRVTGVPFHIAARPGVLTCRKCRRQTGLTVGTVIERSHTPLSTWFWAAYLVASQTPGMSASCCPRRSARAPWTPPSPRCSKGWRTDAVGTAPPAWCALLRGQSAIGLQPSPGAWAEAGFDGRSFSGVGSTEVHAQDRLLVCDVFARHG
jgi:hypothetical protein